MWYFEYYIATMEIATKESFFENENGRTRQHSSQVDSFRHWTAEIAQNNVPFPFVSDLQATEQGFKGQSSKQFIKVLYGLFFYFTPDRSLALLLKPIKLQKLFFTDLFRIFCGCLSAYLSSATFLGCGNTVDIPFCSCFQDQILVDNF